MRVFKKGTMKKFLASFMVGAMLLTVPAVPVNAAEVDETVIEEVTEAETEEVTEEVTEAVTEEVTEAITEEVTEPTIEDLTEDGEAEDITAEFDENVYESVETFQRGGTDFYYAVFTEEAAAEADAEIANIKLGEPVQTAYNASAYDQYKTNYFYNQLTKNEKAFYDRLVTACEKYLTTTTTYSYSSKGYYLIGSASYSGLSTTAAEKVYNFFYMNNSQYYFVDNWLRRDSSNWYISGYSMFSNGTTRKSYTDKIFTQVNGYTTYAAMYATPYLKTKFLFESMADNIVYTYGDYDQSLYSAAYLKKTVCIGYARLFMSACNALGIDCIMVTSEGHAWNNVNINGNWYVVDVTWGDDGGQSTTIKGKYDYYYFLNSQAAIQDSAHTHESYLYGYTPSIPKKYDPYELTVSGIYVNPDVHNVISAACSATTGNQSTLQYQWLYTADGGNTYGTIKGWTTSNNMISWKPPVNGDIIIICNVRRNSSSPVQQAMVATSFHPAISGICQMPNTGKGGGYLIGITTWPGTASYVEMLIYDCSAKKWVHSTGKVKPVNNAMWTTWQPKYGYYWTLFRAYNSSGTLIEEICYPFVNAY